MIEELVSGESERKATTRDETTRNESTRPSKLRLTSVHVPESLRSSSIGEEDHDLMNGLAGVRREENGQRKQRTARRAASKGLKDIRVERKVVPEGIGVFEVGGRVPLLGVDEKREFGGV